MLPVALEESTSASESTPSASHPVSLTVYPGARYEFASDWNRLMQSVK